MSNREMVSDSHTRGNSNPPDESIVKVVRSADGRILKIVKRETRENRERTSASSMCLNFMN